MHFRDDPLNCQIFFSFIQNLFWSKSRFIHKSDHTSLTWNLFLQFSVCNSLKPPSTITYHYSNVHTLYGRWVECTNNPGSKDWQAVFQNILHKCQVTALALSWSSFSLFKPRERWSFCHTEEQFQPKAMIVVWWFRYPLTSRMSWSEQL